MRACWVPLWTAAVEGEIPRTAVTSWLTETPGRAATSISSNHPCSPKMRWATARSMAANWVGPRAVAPAKRKIPVTRNRSRGLRATSPTVVPILRWFLVAVAWSMMISPGPDGQLPLTRLSGFMASSSRVGRPNTDASSEDLPMTVPSALASWAWESM